MKLFAPPSGSYGQETINATKKLGYTAVMWSKDTIDWRDTNVDLIVKRATNSISSGDIILMHPKKHTLQALETIIDKIDKKGLKTDIQVDGGVNHENVADFLDAGANIIVAGSAVFNGDIAENVERFLEILNA